MGAVKTIKTQPEMKNLADFLHNAFKDGGKLFAGGTLFGWFGGWFLVLGDASLNLWASAVKIAVVLTGAAATGFATVAGKDLWIHIVKPKIFKHKNKDNDRGESNVA